MSFSLAVLLIVPVVRRLTLSVAPAALASTFKDSRYRRHPVAVPVRPGAEPPAAGSAGRAAGPKGAGSRAACRRTSPPAARSGGVRAASVLPCPRPLRIGFPRTPGPTWRRCRARPGQHRAVSHPTSRVGTGCLGTGRLVAGRLVAGRLVAGSLRAAGIGARRLGAVSFLPGGRGGGWF